MHFRPACFAVLCAAASSASGATIDKVAPGGGTVILNLSQAEQADLKAGDEITIQTRGPGATPITGKIVEMKGAKAKVAVEPKKGALKAGRAVSVASVANEPMTVTPPPAVETTPVHSATPGYHTSIYHKSIVNPAQIYQVTSARTDVRTSFDSDEILLKSEADEWSANLKGPTLAAAALTANRAGTLRGGLGLKRQQVAGRTKNQSTASSDLDFKIETTEIMPTVGAEVMPGVHAGLSYNVVQVRHAGEMYGGKSVNLSYARAIPGLAYVTSTSEVGVVFEPKISEKSTYTEDDGSEQTISHEEAARVVAHGRATMSGSSSAFGSVAYVQNRMLNVGDEHRFRNNAELVAGVTKDVGSDTEVEGSMFFSSPAHNGDLNKDFSTIMMYGLSAGYEKRYTQSSRFGGSLTYVLGRDSYKAQDEKIKLERDQMEFAVTGTIKL